MDEPNQSAAIEPQLNTRQREELAEFLQSHPPRPVPRFLRRKARGSGSCIVAAVFLMFMAMGSIFAVLFIPWGIFKDWTLNSGAEVVNGQVTEISIKQDTTLTILVKIVIQNDELTSAIRA